MTRSESKQAMLDELGGVPVVADTLDPDQVAAVVARSKPEVIAHQLTAIGSVDLRHMDHDFALVGDGGGVWSFVHVADAAEATVAAVERGDRGVSNVVDGDPGAGRGVAAGPLEVAGGQVTSIHAIVNPDKLTHLWPVGDFGSLWGSAR